MKLNYYKQKQLNYLLYIAVLSECKLAIKFLIEFGATKSLVEEYENKKMDLLEYVAILAGKNYHIVERLYDSYKKYEIKRTQEILKAMKK